METGAGDSNEVIGGTDASTPAVEVRTLADLARVAGVSAGTVSRALAGKALVNAETRERIQTLARHYGFRPNQMASKLRSRRTGVIGVVIPLGHEKRQSISDPFFLTLLGHLADQLTESGYDLMLSRAIPDGTSDWLERITGSGMVDGVLVIGQSDQSGIIDQVAANYRPLVVWGNYREGQVHCVVGTDNEMGGRLAAEHLIASGAKRLAFLGDTTGIEIDMRHRGAASAAKAAGLPLAHIPINLATTEMGPQIKAALAMPDIDYDGFVCASDLIAMSALRVLYETGRAVPDDAQVVGFDDLPMAAQTMPPLTTIRQEIAGGARVMVENLKARIEGESTDSLAMPPSLIVRRTTRA
ncbi:LacI family DNA-binding transcriptional regulator [Novosphingobium sp. AP12]|uniref:LacI family DNA-binding transcriptional regulator n=1 Tax=Novosphingobium sp. AP12 TaxID=1144305 RepID=UPI000271F601|nr:substrate-binding domain-containing protein [Novosphingobium sp. AP12]EJL31155.1 transcriptional regulator [Novosphingobium sp. AP12]